MESPKPLLADIVAATCTHFEITKAEITGRDRSRRFARARQVVHFLADKLTDASLKQIATALGGWDHTSIIFGRRKMAALIAAGLEDMAAQTAAIEAAVMAQAAARPPAPVYVPPVVWKHGNRPAVATPAPTLKPRPRIKVRMTPAQRRRQFVLFDRDVWKSLTAAEEAVREMRL